MTILEFRMKIDETSNYLLQETKQKDLMSEKHKKAGRYLNYAEHLLMVASTGTGCVSIFVFASLIGVSVYVVSSAVRI